MAQENPVKFKVEIEGEFNVDSALTEVFENYRVYGNENDRSDYYFTLNERLNLTTIGWFWLKLMSHDNLTLDTLFAPENQKAIRGVYKLNSSTISVTTLNGSYVAKIENQHFEVNPKVIFVPARNDKLFRKKYYWLSFLTESDTIAALKQKGGKTSTWKVFHYKNGSLNDIFESCEISFQYPFEMTNNSVVLSNEKFIAPMNECEVLLIYNFLEEKVRVLQYPPLEEHFSKRRIYFDDQKNEYFSVCEYKKQRSLYEIQKVNLNQGEFILEGNPETLLLQDLYEIVGFEAGQVHVKSLGLTETIHYMIPYEKLSNIETDIKRLKEVQVDENR